MDKVTGSKIRLDDYNSFYAIEFNDCIDSLLKNEQVKRLDDYRQHLNTSRLQHSINVSYYSYRMCKLFRFDYRSAARAGLLHDLYLYDRKKEKHLRKENHAFYHPKVALQNSREITNINKIEEDAILKHMWPLCAGFPKYKESVVITIADKYCATIEISKQIRCAVSGKLKRVKKKFKYKKIS